ncbi:MAG TPA: decaprenylphospho-beta-D-erythro-pentofuranosid-2-ulose 2-reductase [Egibacteraceae bacterium]|nr:decaprenylphospho-beta-D-erythro-pentofuranosid-2-ulose 2-reductase [Actinomycetota bacterium]HWB71401.1 decaprenylphospho-beta-D-erythro-pentofuranosid-2-ulose 2-reductase [Egibacteraceae bacterium]
MRDALGSVQSIVVLGGTSDIAVATARRLAAPRAATVVLAGRDPDGMAASAQALSAAGAGNVQTVPFDALDTDSHEGFVKDVWDRLGDVDVVLLAFGVLGDQQLAEHDTAEALRIVRTNYLGAVSVLVPVSRQLRAQGHGVLVVLSTVAAERPRRSNFVYGSSKAGLDAFAQGLGDSLVGSGARVVVVRPGFVRTKMTAGRQPAPLATTPEAVAAAIDGAVRGRAETVWVPALLRWIMSALRHLPRPLFRRLDL